MDCADEALLGELSDIRREIDSALSEMLLGLADLEIYPQVRYAVMTEGKRLRPVITILASRCAGSTCDVMPLALAFELVHTATLVHDDIIDQDDVRRERPALHARWSPNDGILTGDVLIALSVKLASGFGEDVMARMAKAAMDLCDGEHIDVSRQGMVSEEAYIRMVRKKCASLFAAAAECGAIAGGANPRDVEALACYGENFGIAYQMRDDLADEDGSPIQASHLRDYLDEHCRLAMESLRSLSDTEEKSHLLRIADRLRLSARKG